MKKRSLINGTIILIISSFIVKILGFVYRIYLSNIIGAEGMGLFQLVLPLYSLVILTLTSGISIAVSKLVSEQFARSNFINLKRIANCAVGLIIFVSIFVSIGILCFVDFLSLSILKDGRTYLSLLIVTPFIPIIASVAAIKGYFYAINNVTPTAISQIVEQGIKIGSTIIMILYFSNYSIEYLCACAILGMVLGEISNLIVLLIIYVLKKDTFNNTNNLCILRKRTIIKKVVRISVPVSVNRFITSVMSAIELILIPRMIQKGGLNYHQSIEEYGKLAGMALPLAYFPALVSSTLATILVPAISESLSLKKIRTVNYRISRSIEITCMLGFIATILFMLYPNEIGNLLYRRYSIGNILFYLSFTCIFLYLQQTLLGILNGLGKQAISLRNSIIGYSVRIISVYFFVPYCGLKGYIVGMVVSLGIVCFLNIKTIIDSTGLTIDLRNWIIKPGVVCIVMMVLKDHIYSFLNIFIRHQADLLTMLCIIVNVAIYFSIMFFKKIKKSLKIL